VDIYIKTLLKLISDRQFKIYIHPVVPVLNETRYIVKMFNEILKQNVEKHTKLHWLNFFDELLSNNGSNLKPEFELDGTHLHPKYVSLLESALNSS